MALILVDTIGAICAYLRNLRLKSEYRTPDASAEFLV